MGFTRLPNIPYPRCNPHRIIPPVHHFFPHGVAPDMLARDGDSVDTVAGCVTNR